MSMEKVDNTASQIPCLINLAEWEAIQVHRYFLSRKYSREVTIDEAIDDWRKFFSQKWREDHPESSFSDGRDRITLSPAEWKAIWVHRYFLSRTHCREVSAKETIEDWIKNHSCQWRQDRMKMSCWDQTKAIQKYKWLESKKAGYDKGKGAILEWIHKYSPEWRKKWEKDHGN